MKIAVAQTRPVKGEIEMNISGHKRLIALAVEHGAGILVFPELSITGYEPELAAALATTPDDARFDDFQLISNGSKIMLGIGAPIQTEEGVMIGLIIFQPNKPRLLYSKQHLHSDELPFFVTGDTPVFLTDDKVKIAFSICYELSVPEHAAFASSEGTNVYVSSVAKSSIGVVNALQTLAATAAQYGMAVLFSDCVGHCDNFDCGGKSSVIDSRGQLLAQLNENDEGILIFDTDTETIIEKTL